MPFYDGIRIEPADSNGIHLVQNIGGESIYLSFKNIPQLINELNLVLKTKGER